METSDAPRILGVFSLRKDSALGYAGTARQGQSVTYWFAVQCGPEKFALHALSPSFLPTPVKARAERAQFLSEYVAEPETYTRELLPRLRQRLTELGLYPGPEPATVQERSKELEALGLACDGPEKALALLVGLAAELARAPEDAASAHCGTIVKMAIDQRKLNLLQEAMDSYHKALILSPEDDHLHFNLARIFFDLKDWRSAMTHARKALDINPGLDYARKMVDFISRKGLAAAA